MTLPKKIAFFAPIKPPDHPIPSGDRLIAGNLLKALKIAGFQPELASRYICYSKRSSLEILEERKQGALEEAQKIIAEYKNRPASKLPDVWVTYHPYCKAPDWIGPIVSREFGIPYVTIEAAKTGQGVNDEWLPWRKQAQAGMLTADRHICFKPTDKTYLTELLGSDQKLSVFPAFIDTDEGTSEEIKTLPKAWDKNVPVLVTTGMMRPGKKVKNFEILASVLENIGNEDWNLIVVGGGPELENIQKLFSKTPNERILWTGQVEHAEVLQWMRASDIFIWPGWKEPIGMVYLEAQLQGLPVIASKSMGVPLVVEHGTSGLLSEESNTQDMTANVCTLLNDKKSRQTMGSAAKAKVLNQHSLEAAAKRLKEILSKL